MTAPSTTYRPALRGLVFGLAAMGLRAATVGLSVLVASREVQHGTLSSSMNTAMQLLPVMNLVATLVALMGVGYSAIAAHRREWGAVLVLAFVFSVAAAVLDIQPFVYAVF